MPVAHTEEVVMLPVVGPVDRWDVDAIRKLSALIVAASDWPEMPSDMTREDRFAASDVYNDARQKLHDEYGGAHRAAIIVGELVAARAAEISGLSHEQLTADLAVRVEATNADWVEKTAIRDAAIIVARAEGLHAVPQEVSEPHYAAYLLASATKSGNDVETKENMRKLTDGYMAALAEIRPFGGTLAFTKGSQPKAVKAFQGIAELFPSEWIEASNAYDRPLHAKYSTARAHYADSRNETEVTSPHG